MAIGYYWGSEPPVIEYGVAYGSSWDLSALTSTTSIYPTWSWKKEYRQYVSKVNGHVTVQDKSATATYGRMEITIEINNMTDSEVETARALRDQITVRVEIHQDSPNSWKEEFQINEFEIMASPDNGKAALEYPTANNLYLKMISSDYVKNPNDTPT